MTNLLDFCYIESWGHGKFVANSGLIVHPDYRKQGLAKKIKAVVFEHSRTKFPNAKSIFNYYRIACDEIEQ